MNTTLQLIVQCGALGLLAALGYGAYQLAKVYAPLVKDFLVGLIATQQGMTEALAAMHAKVDGLGTSITKLEGTTRERAESIERSVERSRDDVLAAVAAAKSSPRPAVTTPLAGLSLPAHAR